MWSRISRMRSGRSLSQKIPLNVDTRPRGPVRRATRATSSRHALVLTSGMNSRNAPRSTSTSRSSPSSSSSASTLGVGSLVRIFVEPRGREPEGAGDQRLVEHRGHGAPFLGRGGPVPRVLTHDEHAQRGVTDLRGDVHGARQRAERVEVFGKGRPAPRHRLGEHRRWHVFDVREHRAQPLALLGVEGRERERAVADEHRGDTVLGHRVAGGIPEERGVEVRVRVDEAREPRSRHPRRARARRTRS